MGGHGPPGSPQGGGCCPVSKSSLCQGPRRCSLHVSGTSRMCARDTQLGSSPVCVNSRRATDSVLVLGGPCSPRYSLAPGTPFFPSMWHRCAHLQGPKALLREGSRSQNREPSWGDWPWGGSPEGRAQQGRARRYRYRDGYRQYTGTEGHRDVDGTGRDRWRRRWCLPCPEGT